MRNLERDLIMASIVIVVFSVSLIIERLMALAVVPLLLFLFPSRFSAGVRDIHFSAPAYVGDEVIIRFAVNVVGLGYAKIVLKTEGIMDVSDGNPKAGGFVPFFRKFTVNVRGKAIKRGKINFGQTEVIFNDIFLLKESTKELEMDATAEVKVRVKKVRKVRARRKKVRESYPDIDISKIGVPGTDFREIRAYIPGDPVKFINWKATAKRNDILVNEFEVEGKRAVWFVVNTSSHSFSEREYLENALTVTASLAYYFTKRGHKTALTLTGSGKTIHPDLGKKQFYRMMFELTNAEFSGKDSLIAMREVKKLIMYHMPFVVYITHIHDDMNAVVELIKSGLKCKTVVVAGKEYENDLAKIARELMTREKLRRGADVMKDVIRVRM